MIELSKTLTHLPEKTIKELEYIAQGIANTQKAEIVILFGSYARGNYKEKRGKIQGKKSDYDILVITSDADTRKGLRMQLRGIFRDVDIPVQVVVEKIKTVNNNLEEEQFFFTDIKREGKILFNSGKLELSEPKKLTPTRRREIAEADFREWIKMANQFFDNAKFNIGKNYSQVASFMFQQTVEMCYTGIEMVFNHYKPHEHNLEALRYRALKYDCRVNEALSFDTTEQRELFDYLNLAYIGGRYQSEEEYPVTTNQLEYWEKEVKKLLEVTEIICQERIECLREMEDNN